MKNLLMLCAILSTPTAYATGCPAGACPSLALITNSVSVNASLTGAGSSTTSGVSASDLTVVKGDTLSIQGQNQAALQNASTGAGNGSGTATGQVAGAAFKKFDALGTGGVGVNINTALSVGKNAASDVDAAAKATVTLNDTKTGDIKTSIGQITGTGAVSGFSNAGAVFSTLPGCPDLPNISLPKF